MEEAVAADLSKVKVVNETYSVGSEGRTLINSKCCTCQTEAGETTPLLKYCNEHLGEDNANICAVQELPARKRMTKRQIALLVLVSYGHFWISTCYSLLAPFFPAEATKKGASPTVYGLVFGVFQLIFFIMSPIYGKIIPAASPRFLIISGMFVSSTCSVLFGSLYYSSAGLPFIILSFAVRIVEALGTSAYTVAALTAVSSEFPENRATVLSLIESVAGIGTIVGPTVGGALYQAGGYTLPFYVLGGILFLGSVVAIPVVPYTEQTEETGNLAELLSKANLYIYWVMFTYCFCGIGYVEATLSDHLSSFHFKPSIVGLIFIIPGGIYAFGAPVWGFLCDKVVRPEICCFIGSVAAAISFLFIGPVPFLGLNTELWMVILSLVLMGIGFGAIMISGFIMAISYSVKEGLPDDVSTYALVSGLFTSVAALGGFIGPSIGGVMVDHIGYKHSTLVFFGMSLVIVIVLLPRMLCSCSRSKDDQQPPLKKT